MCLGQWVWRKGGCEKGERKGRRERERRKERANQLTSFCSEKPIAKDIETAKALIKIYREKYAPKGLIWRVAEVSSLFRRPFEPPLFSFRTFVD